MKKNGRKYRKIQKQKADYKLEHPQKVGEPFSKVRYKKKICYHHTGIGIMKVSSQLSKISERECMCLKCKKRFPIGAMGKMDNLVTQLNLLGYWLGKEKIEKLSEGIEPVEYYKLSESEMEYIEA